MPNFDDFYKYRVFRIAGREGAKFSQFKIVDWKDSGLVGDPTGDPDDPERLSVSLYMVCVGVADEGALGRGWGLQTVNEDLPDLDLLKRFIKRRK